MNKQETEMARACAQCLKLAVVLGIVVGNGGAMAQDSGDGTVWQFELTPYLWAARMNGDIQVGPLPQTTLDMKFSDILSTLDFGFMGSFEARKRRWGLFFDGMYMKNSDAVSATLPGGPSAAAELELRQTVLAGAVFYRAVEGAAPVDLFAGLRYTHIEADATIGGSLYGQPVDVLRQGDKGWTDPYLGVRLAVPLAEKWTAVGYADFGGFDVGSDRAVQASIGARYAFSDAVTASFGYRYLRTDYDDGGFLYDMKNDGVYAGLGFRL